MDIASLVKSGEKEHLLKPIANSRGWCAEKPQLSENTLVVDRPVRAVPLRSGASSREEKRLTHKLQWIDMLTNALIVIVITSVSYFFIAARTTRPVMETSSIGSESQSSESR
jgi:hypothetical protein